MGVIPIVWAIGNVPLSRSRVLVGTEIFGLDVLKLLRSFRLIFIGNILEVEFFMKSFTCHKFQFFPAYWLL